MIPAMHPRPCRPMHKVCSVPPAAGNISALGAMSKHPPIVGRLEHKHLPTRDMMCMCVRARTCVFIMCYTLMKHRYTDRHVLTDRHTDRQTDRQTDRKTDRQNHTLARARTHTHTHTHTQPAARCSGSQSSGKNTAMQHGGARSRRHWVRHARHSTLISPSATARSVRANR